ncbi:MAG: class I SAM-dependent methyltransferase [Parcubacteria group bacterium]
MDTNTADKIVEKTRADYEAIAKAFTESRTNLWEEAHYFGQYLQDNVAVLDLGCANGRLLKLFEKHKVAYTGVDENAMFLQAAGKYAKTFSNVTATFVQSDMRKLPFADNSFDRAFCIASLHHVPSSEYQLQAIIEMYRVLKPGGLLLMTNWELASQPRYVKKRDKLRMEHPELFQGLDDTDFVITWRWSMGDTTVYRYYHSFSELELRVLLESAGFSVEGMHASTGALNPLGQRVKKNIVTIASKRG